MGPVEVYLNGKIVKFATRKALAMFSYLVVESGTHPREKLLALFWPESETHLAQAALRNTLARIKEGLKSVNEPLIIAGDRIGFNFSVFFTLDLDLVKQATLESAFDKTTLSDITLLKNAVDSIRGSFLDGFSLPDAPAFDEWLTFQRSVWTNCQNQIFDRLSLYLLENHLFQPAIETVNIWINRDRFNETAYQRLMRLHYLNNARHAAIQTYETCRNMLMTELGIEPSPETQKIFVHIQSNPPTLSHVDSQVNRQTNFQIPFAGRLSECKILVKSFRTVQKGESQVIVISGDTGIGKTRLVDEFSKWAKIEGADIMRGRSFEMSDQMPFQPIIESLRERLERENSPEDLLDDIWLVELSRILPELRGRYPDLELPACDEITAQARLFEAILRFTLSLSKQRPLVWVMDEFDRVDNETLLLLQYLLHNWQTSQASVLLLFLVNSNSIKNNTSLNGWLNELHRFSKVTNLSLSEMTSEDIRMLIYSMAGENAPGSSDLINWLITETGGSPTFISEILTTLNKSGALIWREESSYQKLDPSATISNMKMMNVQLLISGMRERFLKHLEWVSQPAIDVLIASGVIGQKSNLISLCQVAGIDEQTGIKVLNNLVATRLNIKNKNEATSYLVPHENIRYDINKQINNPNRQTFL
jgi:DNA-binding SARP family transcriptional activator